jgi:hypothetical protein
MNASNLETLLTHLATVAMTSETRIPVCLWGESGVGKSETIAKVAADLGIGFVDWRLGQKDQGDVVGLPTQSTDENGEEVMNWSRPADFPTEGRGILLLDELNRSHMDIRNSVFQVLLDGCIGVHELPKGWIVVAACNPDTEDYDAVDSMQDHAFLSRFMHIAFQPTTDEWLAHAEKTGVDWSIRALIESDHSLLGKRAASLPEGIAPTPRSWSILGKLLLTTLPQELEFEAATGLLGALAATAWLKVRNEATRPVSADAVLADYSAVRSKVIKFKAENREDLLRITMGDLCGISERRDLSDSEFANLVACILDMPEDIAYANLKFRMVTNPRLGQRLAKQTALINFVKKINQAAGV